MSNEKHETIADIVREMRIGHLCANDTSARSMYINDFLAGYADRIETAVNQPVTDCNHLGNAAKMRDALVKADAAFRRISQSAWFIDANFSETKEVMDAGNAVTSALSATPRNCDRFATLEDARNAFFADYVPDETCSSATAFAIWLFAEAKGCAKYECITQGSEVRQ